MSKRWRMRPIAKTPMELRMLLSDKKNHYTMISVTQHVLDNLTSDDYDEMLECGVILWLMRNS